MYRTSAQLENRLHGFKRLKNIPQSIQISIECFTVKQKYFFLVKHRYMGLQYEYGE